MSLTIDQSGSGRPAMIVHGGGGPLTVAPLSAHLAETMHAVTPTLPGWNGVPRPESIQAIGDIAGVFLDWLAEHDLTDVLVVGSSIGGWIAAEMAVRDRKTSISGLVLIDTVGIEVAGEPITDFFALDPRGVVEHSFHDPDRFFVDPATLTPERRATQQANMASLRALAGDPSPPGTGGRMPPPCPGPASSSSPTPATCHRSRSPRRRSR